MEIEVQDIWEVNRRYNHLKCLNFRNHNDFSTDALMLDLKLIKFYDFNKYFVYQFMHKLHSGLVPNVFNDYYLRVIVLFMIITHVWVKVSMHLKLEMIVEDEYYSTMVVYHGTQIYFWMSILTVL